MIYKIFVKATLLLMFLILNTNVLSLTTSEVSAFSDCEEECKKLYKKMKIYAFNGSPHAQTMLALSYRNGYHTEVDVDRADNYLKRAANNKYPPAILEQGKKHYKNNDHELGQKLIIRAAKLGDLNAKRLLKIMSPQNEDIKKKISKMAQIKDINNEEKFGEVLTIFAADMTPVQQLSFVLERINDMEIYNRKGSVASRVSDIKCGNIASSCRVMSGVYMRSTGFNTVSGLLTGPPHK